MTVKNVNPYRSSSFEDKDNFRVFRGSINLFSSSVLWLQLAHFNVSLTHGAS